MNPQFLTRQAIRRAQRESKKRGHLLTREEILRLRIQTVAPWRRIVFIVIGLGGVGLACLPHAPWWFQALCATGAAALILFGTFGKEASLDQELQKLDAEGPTRILDTIVSSLLDGLF